eukprot:2134109-Prymnesium_polylepis.1
MAPMPRTITYVPAFFCTKLLIAAARALDSPESSRRSMQCCRIDAFGGIVERASAPSASNEKTDQRRQSSKRVAESSKDRGVRDPPAHRAPGG